MLTSSNGFDWQRGDMPSPRQLDCVAQSMADLLLAALARRPGAVEHLYLTDPIGELTPETKCAKVVNHYCRVWLSGKTTDLADTSLALTRRVSDGPPD